MFFFYLFQAGQYDTHRASRWNKTKHWQIQKQRKKNKEGNNSDKNSRIDRIDFIDTKLENYAKNQRTDSNITGPS